MMRLTALWGGLPGARVRAPHTYEGAGVGSPHVNGSRALSRSSLLAPAALKPLRHAQYRRWSTEHIDVLLSCLGVTQGWRLQRKTMGLAHVTCRTQSTFASALFLTNKWGTQAHA